MKPAAGPLRGASAFSVTRAKGFAQAGFWPLARMVQDFMESENRP